MTTARRFARLLLELLRPFGWLFALLGAALILWPAWGFGSVEDGSLRPGGDVTMEITGGWILPDDNGDEHPAGAWHPRMLSVKWLREPLPAEWAAQLGPSLDALPEGVSPDAAALALAYNQCRRGGPGFYFRSEGGPLYHRVKRPPPVVFPYLGLVTGQTAAGTHEFARTVFRYDSETRTFTDLSLLGPPHRVRGVAISLWPLVVAAGIVGFLRWRRTVGRRERGEDAAAPGLPRRMARPWIGLSAAIGLGVVAGGGSHMGFPLGPYSVTTHIVRGPADVPHPRGLKVWAHENGQRPPPGSTWGPSETFHHNAPSAGLWSTQRIGGGGTGFGATVSLWWFAAAGLLANAVTLWRVRRARRRIVV